MTRIAGRQLLAALRDSLAGRQKLCAHETWPGANDAEARMSRVLSGELNPPPELLVLALRGPGGERLLDYFRSVAEADPATIRRSLLSKVTELRGQLEFFFEEMHRADEAEKRMAKVEPQRASDRRRA